MAVLRQPRFRSGHPSRCQRRRRRYSQDTKSADHQCATGAPPISSWHAISIFPQLSHFLDQMNAEPTRHYLQPILRRCCRYWGARGDRHLCQPFERGLGGGPLTETRNACRPRTGRRDAWRLARQIASLSNQASAASILVVGYPAGRRARQIVAPPATADRSPWPCAKHSLAISVWPIRAQWRVQRFDDARKLRSDQTDGSWPPPRAGRWLNVCGWRCATAKIFLFPGYIVGQNHLSQRTAQ